MTAPQPSAKAAARTSADEQLAKIIAAEAAATPAELRLMLADMRQMLLDEATTRQQLTAMLTEIGGKFSEIVLAYMQGDSEKLTAALERIVAENVVVKKGGVTTLPAGERMQ